MVIGDVGERSRNENLIEDVCIRRLLSIGIKPIDNHDLIPLCNPILSNIKAGKGGICIYCRTWFTVMLSLNQHLKRKCINEND